MNLGLPKYCAPASLLNWLRHLSEMRLSEGWQLAVRQQWRCRTDRLWSRCGLLSYPMGSCWGPRRGEAFPDWKWQTSFPYVQLPCVPWKFPLGKVSAVPAVSMLQGCPILFSFQTLKKWYADMQDTLGNTAGTLKKSMNISCQLRCACAASTAAHPNGWSCAPSPQSPVRSEGQKLELPGAI